MNPDQLPEHYSPHRNLARPVYVSVSLGMRQLLYRGSNNLSKFI